MPVPVTCNSCNTKLKASDSAAGRKVKCPKCGTLLSIPNGTAAPAVVRATISPTKMPSSGANRPQAEREEPAVEAVQQKHSASHQDALEGFDISAKIKKEARKRLNENEKVIWVGKPVQKLILVRSLVVLVGGLVAAIAVGLMLRQSLGLALFSFLVLLAIAVGVPLLRCWRASRTLYVLTPERATVWEPNRFGVLTARDYTPDILSKMFRRDSWFIKGAGDLVFRKKTVIRKTLYVKRQTGPYYASNSKGTVRSTSTTYYWGFLAIENVAHVEQLVNDHVIAPFQNKANQAGLPKNTTA